MSFRKPDVRWQVNFILSQSYAFCSLEMLVNNCSNASNSTCQILQIFTSTVCSLPLLLAHPATLELSIMGLGIKNEFPKWC